MRPKARLAVLLWTEDTTGWWINKVVTTTRRDRTVPHRRHVRTTTDPPPKRTTTRPSGSTAGKAHKVGANRTTLRTGRRVLPTAAAAAEVGWTTERAGPLGLL